MQCVELEKLAERIREIESGGRESGGGAANMRQPVATGWTTPPWRDEHGARGLARGMVHEWLGLSVADQTVTRRQPWAPPLSVLTHLARCGLEGKGRSDAERSEACGLGVVLWIGRAVWPSVHALVGGAGGGGVGRRLMEASLWVDPPDDAGRLWAIDLALRSPAVSVVIADGRRLDLAASRRLQVAAAAGSALCLIARPIGEQAVATAAAMRWSVQTAPTEDRAMRFRLRLLRCKPRALRPHRLPEAEGNRAAALWVGRDFLVERDHANACLHSLAPVVDRPDATTPASRAEPSQRRTA